MPKRADGPLAPLSFLAQLGLLPPARSSTAGARGGAPCPRAALGRRRWNRKCPCNPAAGHGGIGDVQVAVGLRQYRVQPQTITGYMRVIAHQACHQQDRRRRGPDLRRTRRRVRHGLAEPFPVKAAEESRQPPSEYWAASSRAVAIRCASSTKPYRTRPAAIMALSCGQTEPLW
jgi:hypothetical protein